MDASPYYYAYTRGLPSRSQHSQVTLVTPRGILLSGSENIVCLCSAYLPPLSAHSYEAGLGLVTRGLCRMAHTKMVILFREKGYFFSQKV